MKKVYIVLTFILVIISFSTTVFADNPYNSKDFSLRKKAIEKALDELLEPYKNENKAENERIENFSLTGYGISKEDDKMIKVAITFMVVPYSEENTIWETKVNNYCYATFKKENGDYILENITQEIENLDKFLARFEEYKKEHPESETEKIEVQEVEAKKENYNNSNTYKTISIGVYIGSAILFVVGIILIKMKSRI